MREDHILDRIHIDAERAERFHRTAQERPLALLRYLRIEAGVDDESTPPSSRHPHEVVHRHRPVVRVAADEMVAAPRLAGGIADGKEFVFLFGHGSSGWTGNHFASTSLTASRALRKAAIPARTPQSTATC